MYRSRIQLGLGHVTGLLAEPAMDAESLASPPPWRSLSSTALAISVRLVRRERSTSSQ